MHHHTDSASERIGWAFLLNVSFTVLEFIGGWLTNSTAIMADAVHDLGDSLSIGTAWLLNKLSDKQANTTYTYGYRRFSLLGALINGLVLIVGSVWVLSTAIPRLTSPEMPMVEGMLAFSIFGIAVNGFAAFKLSKGKTLNERVLNWHLLEDVLGWVAVFIVSIVLLFIELPILDPLLSIAFTLFILINVLKNLIGAIRVFLQSVPDDLDQTEIETKLASIDNVDSVHHLHIWSLDGEHHVVTAHLVLEKGVDIECIHQVKETVMDTLGTFQLAHTTIELELPNEDCRDP